jgi:hypothetical protein
MPAEFAPFQMRVSPETRNGNGFGKNPDMCRVASDTGVEIAKIAVTRRIVNGAELHACNSSAAQTLQRRKRFRLIE